MAARARSGVLPFRMRLLGSILIPPGFGRPKVSTVKPDSVPITSMVFSSGFPSVSMRKSTGMRSEEHTSELQSPDHLVCRLLLEKKNTHLPTSEDNLIP